MPWCVMYKLSRHTPHTFKRGHVKTQEAASRLATLAIKSSSRFSILREMSRAFLPRLPQRCNETSAAQLPPRSVDARLLGPGRWATFSSKASCEKRSP